MNVECFWLSVGFLIGSNVKTAFTREAATAGANVPTTSGKENLSRLTK